MFYLAGTSENFAMRLESMITRLHVTCTHMFMHALSCAMQCQLCIVMRHITGFMVYSSALESGIDKSPIKLSGPIKGLSFRCE
jgi:hypothetical protein